jgi:hypothetical protein
VGDSAPADDRWGRGRSIKRERRSMFDLVLVLAGIGFFGMMLIYAGICERL